jgi:hypothetical protein
VLYRILGEERGDGGCVAAVFSLVIRLTDRKDLLGYLWIGYCSFFWAKVGKAKLIASPTSAISKRVFIVSSGRFRMIVAYRPASGFLASRDVHVAGTEKDLS